MQTRNQGIYHLRVGTGNAIACNARRAIMAATAEDFDRDGLTMCRRCAALRRAHEDGPHHECRETRRRGCRMNPFHTSPALLRSIRVEWVDADCMTRLAKERGWTEEGSLLDFVEQDECEKSREFPSLTKAKAWAVRNRNLCVWRHPDIATYEWPDERRRVNERERVSLIRYVGDGQGWEDVQ